LKRKKAIAALFLVAMLLGMISCISPEVVLVSTSASALPQFSASPTPAAAPTVQPSGGAHVTAAVTPFPEPRYVSLLFAGDVMAHKKQIDCHRFGAVYDFTDDYIYIQEIISAADIAVVNLETPMTGEGPYAGYPHFNAPDSLADALLYAGVDVIATANNHALDQGIDGAIRTCSFLRNAGFEVVGTDSGEGGTKYALRERNGIRVGFVNFTNSLNEGYPEEAMPYVNCLHDADGTERGYQALERQIASLRALGADFIVVYMHWGNEYQLQANEAQEAMAKTIADMGADLIIGSHPHVLQNVAEYTSPFTGKTVLIYYSLGNLVSNQPYGYGPGRGNCETGALALIRLARLGTGSVGIDAAGYLTTYVLKPDVVHEYVVDGQIQSRSTRAYYIVPSAAALADPASYVGAQGACLDHIGQSIENGRELLGQPGGDLAHFNFREYDAFEW
jgi:poly-gamma-glutamate capsule biosynthesis protein CapA/YwtB (metallophosphatase superfamily)